MLSHETYLKIREWYWTCNSHSDTLRGRVGTTVFSRWRPDQVPNMSMKWDHPTWEILSSYQENWDRYNKDFLEKKRSLKYLKPWHKGTK